MKNVKKLTALLLAGIMSVSMLAGCGGGKEKTPAGRIAARTERGAVAGGGAPH